MNIINLLRKRMIKNESFDQSLKLNYLKKLDTEADRLKLKKKSILGELRRINKKIFINKNEIIKISSSITLRNEQLVPLISIGFDKRSKTYNCIYDIGRNKFCIYIGSEKKIRDKLQEYYIDNIIYELSINDVISDLKEIIRLTFEDLDFKTLNEKKISFPEIMYLYNKSGKWSYWKKSNPSS